MYCVNKYCIKYNNLTSQIIILCYISRSTIIDIVCQQLTALSIVLVVHIMCGKSLSGVCMHNKFT